MSHPKKIEQILSMPGPDRYSYFVRKSADFEEIWGLHDDGWAMTEDPQGRKAIPFWPEKEFAEVCCEGVWQSYKPKMIELEAFLQRWVAGMEKDGVLAAVFPTPNDKGVIVEPSSVADDLGEEMEQYE